MYEKDAYFPGTNHNQKNPEYLYESNQIVLSEVWPVTNYPAGNLDEMRWAQKDDKKFWIGAVPLAINWIKIGKIKFKIVTIAKILKKNI